MQRVVPVLLILLAIAVCASLAWLFLASSYPGSRGEAVEEQRALAPFTRVVIEGFAEATLVHGDRESVTIQAPAKLLPQVRTEVSDGTLTIAYAPSRRWWSGFLGGGGARAARLTIAYRNLEAIDVSGAVKLRADQVKSDRLGVSASGAASLRIVGLDTRELSVSGSGAMKAELAGRAVEQRVAISGAGDYRAADLVSDDARVMVSGAGRVVVHAEKTLRIGISGAGSVEYLGDPKVTERVSGAGRIRRREAARDTPVVAKAPVDPGGLAMVQ